MQSADPGFLLVAWDRVCGNTGARTAGIDRRTARNIEDEPGVPAFLEDLWGQLRSRAFCPMLVWEWMIPKSGSQAAAAQLWNQVGAGSTPGGSYSERKLNTWRRRIRFFRFTVGAYCHQYVQNALRVKI